MQAEAFLDSTTPNHRGSWGYVCMTFSSRPPFGHFSSRHSVLPTNPGARRPGTHSYSSMLSSRSIVHVGLSAAGMPSPPSPLPSIANVNIVPGLDYNILSGLAIDGYTIVTLPTEFHAVLDSIRTKMPEMLRQHSSPIDDEWPTESKSSKAKWPGRRMQTPVTDRDLLDQIERMVSRASPHDTVTLS